MKKIVSDRSVSVSDKNPINQLSVGKMLKSVGREMRSNIYLNTKKVANSPHDVVP